MPEDAEPRRRIAVRVRRRGLRSAVVAAALLALAGLGAAAGVPAITAEATPSPAASREPLEVWHAYRGAERIAFEQAVADFSAATGIATGCRAVPYDAMADRVTATVPRGLGPDVFVYAQDRLGEWVESRQVLWAPPALDPETMARFLPSTRDALTYRGTVWALPLNYKVLALIYNRALVSEPPRDVGELRRLARRLAAPGTPRWPLAYWHSNFYYHAALLHPLLAGEDAVFDRAGRVRLATAQHTRSFATLRSWLASGLLAPADSAAAIAALFNAGRAATVIEGPWFLGEIDPAVDYGVALLPQLEKGGAMRPWITVEGVFIAAGAPDKPAALALAKHLTGTAAGKLLALDGRQTPANKSVYLDPAVAGDEVLARFYEQVQRGLPMPNDPRMGKVWPAVDRLMKEILAGSPAAAALEEAQRAAGD